MLLLLVQKICRMNAYNKIVCVTKSCQNIGNRLCLKENKNGNKKTERNEQRKLTEKGEKRRTWLSFSNNIPVSHSKLIEN